MVTKTKAPVKRKHLTAEEKKEICEKNALIANIDLNQEALIIKAKTFATVLSITDFKGTGWVNGFQEQFGLSQYNRNGKALSSPPVESLNEHKERFQAICEEYTLNNI
ncbi:6512_t:CDS:2 [Cetraspora pellucida]|uniref:6512_t:CDS:1 n=1 Tax=Cetraspora pellucida TaxID=1433469 RepID=A0ACA9KQV7_9GLOM|nr:6512_t:CDS:2 [Cetraspora pellucida]